MPASPATARLIGRLGLLLLLVGLVATSYVVWQTFGTTWQSERRHEDQRSGVERQWRDRDATIGSE